MPDSDVATAGLDDRALPTGLNLNGSAAGFSYDLAVGLMHHDRAAAGMERCFTSNRPDLYGPATGFGAYAATDVIHVNSPTATFCFDAARDSAGFHVSAIGFKLQYRNLTRNIDGEFTGEMTRLASLPVADDPARVSLYIGRDFKAFELAAGFLL